ncbi:Cytochrome P450 [Macleaya cordata]|uniref:Cytochrome P450 n=1 Tax=Macleaya cordata TaxID=56857 RepID=A0A200R7B9_MACCD|nr:Cytochrome P450 [Macleaya cordata]
MASSTLSSFSSLKFNLQTPRKITSTRRQRHSIFCPVSTSLSQKPPSSSDPLPSSTDHPKLPIKKIPGDYGIPLISPTKDRLDYFYFQGRELYFKSKIQKYQSTVYRANMPPGPFISSNPKVVVLLDGKSFPVLFDMSLVEKKDVFTGTYMPSTELTGGYRILSYLDPSEPNHANLKNLMFFLLKSRRDRVIPEFRSSFSELFETVESELSAKGKADFGGPSDQACFNFLARSLYGTNPADTKLGRDGPKLVSKWILFQLGPLLTLGLPWLLEDALIHTFRLPPFLVKKDYQKLYDFFYQASGWVLDEGEKMGIKRDEACHNLLFTTCFNSFGGMKLFFPNMVKWIGRSGVKLHRQLAEEIRSAVRSNGGKVTMAVMEKMPLMKSVVYEALRMEPPVPAQYGRAKRDFVIESHDSAFEIKEGELLFGFQPFATRDPKIFERGEEFVADRFIGEEGEKLLKHVLWSNGRETENPTVENKQCAGKDFVVLASRLLVVELFLRYDTFESEAVKSALGVSVTLKSLKRATF